VTKVKVSGTESSEASTSSKIRLSSSAVLDALLAPGCGHRNCSCIQNSILAIKPVFEFFLQNQLEAEVYACKHRENNAKLGRLHSRASRPGGDAINLSCASWEIGYLSRTCLRAAAEMDSHLSLRFSTCRT
jgi:hypothetical protein